MKLDKSQLENDVLQFIQSRCPDSPDVTAATDLLENSILDSLLLMDLIFEIEDRYGVRLATDQIDPSNFRTASAVASLVLAQTNPHSA